MSRHIVLFQILITLWAIAPVNAQSPSTLVSIRTSALSPDGTQLAISGGGNPGAVFVYDVNDLNTPTRVIEMTNGFSYDVAFDATGTLLAYAGEAAGPDEYATTVLDLENDTTRTYPGGQVAVFVDDQLITAYQRDTTNYNLLRLDLETGAAQAVYTIGYTIDDIAIHAPSKRLGVVGCAGPYTQSDGGAGDGCLDPSLVVIDLKTDTGTALTLLEQIFAPPLAWAADGTSIYTVETAVVSADPPRNRDLTTALAANGLQRQQRFSYDPIRIDGSVSKPRDLAVTADGTLLTVYNYELVAFDPITGEARALWQIDPNETNRTWQTLSVGGGRAAFSHELELIVYDLNTETEIGRITVER